MHALPLVLALVCALVIASPLLRALSDGSHTKPNYRQRELPFPFGVLALAASLLALIPLTLLARVVSESVFEPRALPLYVYALGVLGLGLVDDTLARSPTAERGWGRHAAAVLRGEFSTGALKAAGSLGLALFALSYLGLSDTRWLLAAGVLVLATNVFNLIDLRPGRSTKVFALLGAVLTLAALDLKPLWTLGLLAAPALVAGFYDLRERAMLGDTGANLLGALAGLWLVLTLSGLGQLLALVVLLVVTVYGELRSISALIERVPLLRELDSWGRPS